MDDGIKDGSMPQVDGKASFELNVQDVQHVSVCVAKQMVALASVQLV